MSKFNCKHQALLIAWINRAVVQEIGDDEGERIIRKATKIYAMQRGGRMAQRARMNGDALTMNSYYTYVEWVAQKGDFDQKIVEKMPDSRIHVFKCPFHDVWKENNLMPYGRFYCLEVDKGVVKGFNKDLHVDVLQTKPNGADYCDLIFKEGHMNVKNMLKFMYKKYIKLGKKVIKHWEYHCGHTYKTMKDVIQQELGSRSEGIMEKALQDFTDRFGQESTDIVTSYEHTDFNSI
ncbi:L-2-amino-thiazoline-4-carboxylic acid hydrolase [Vallitalea pronyensis]|uniref:L-2-amino-thiazoline-4-carboxylic acid hydrolase n=1 Tax=Vallitalea pronyensis TaxID=1348613 RepID=A0A8J8SG81_9FIRM|nr:L-2-amino-thiazoline-4-carboxylic acid hydrolase [Vallitalea pronyensis]QUI22107.1 L-2-amino-thiazoline-4-carboxylic acid hydrolase [Vallitalea pronyensis]